MDMPVESRHIPVLPFFDLVLWWNRGVSFGMLVHDFDFMPYLLTALALVIAFALCFWLWRARRHMDALALGLVIGGAIGNAIDRLRFGAVVDFIYFYAGTWYWPAFNIADSAICVGVVLMLIYSYMPKIRTGQRLQAEADAKSNDTVGSGPKSA
jgi:signal peptidase II